jgi:DHA2 family lincomycin resistance protein-like MFS transporter
MIPNEDNGKINANKILIILLLAGFMSMLNETALNIAFPQIMIEFSVSAGTVQWLTTVYVLVSGIVFLVSAFLIQRFSTKKLFLSAMVFLIIGTIVSGISPNFALLLLGRIIQAVGTGILVPLMFNTVLILIDPEKRGFVMGLVTLVIISATVIAPVGTGLLMNFMDWHWLFLLLFLFFAGTTIAGISFVRNVTELNHPQLDVASVILATLGFGGVIIALSNLGDNGFLNLQVITPFIIGILSLLIFGKRQLSLDHPLLDLHPFKYSSFAIGVVINSINVMMVFAVVVILPIYLQTALGITAFMASLVMLPGGIINSLLSIVSGRIYDEHGPRMVISGGIAIACIGMLAFSQITTTTVLLLIVLIHCVFLTGSALIMAPNQTNTLGNLPKEYYPSGSALMTSLQQIGGAIGSSLFVSFMSLGQNSYLSNIYHPNQVQNIQAMVYGVDISFLIGGILLAATLVISLFLKHEKAV